MSLIAEMFQTKASPVPAGSLRPVMGPGISYQVIGGSLIPIADNSENYIKKGYNVNDIIYSIINLILDKVRIAPWSIYEIVDESSLKSFHSIQRKADISSEDFRKSRDLQHKALKPVKNPGKWAELLKYPNEQDSFQELVANGAGYKMLTGNKYIWGNRLDAGANQGMPYELWTMPSQWMQVVAQGGFPAKVLWYNMPNLGFVGLERFEKEEVLHEKYMNYNYDANGSHLVGMSPLKAGLKRMNRSNSAVDISTAKLQNGGLETIIYLDEQGVNKDDGMASMAALKQKLISEYTGPDNYGKIAASGYKIGAVNLGLTPVELAIIESEKWDLRMFCNLLGGIPSQLMNDPENRSYNNQKEGEKALTSRAALSHLTSMRESLNRKGHENWTLPKNWICDFDMTVYSELQQDVGEMVKWIEPLAKLTGLSPNRILELMNLEKINDKVFDEPWIRDGMGQPKSEWDLNEVDKNLNQNDEE